MDASIEKNVGVWYNDGVLKLLYEKAAKGFYKLYKAFAKRIYIFFLVFLFLSSTLAFAGAEPGIKASSAILAIADGEQILYEKNPDQKLPPAGLTMLMTALTAYEICGMDSNVVVPENITELYSPLEQNMGLSAGEEISSGSLIKAIIVGSSNDAAVALAIHCSGSTQEFVSRMNAKGQQMGLASTNFTNPTGKHDEMQYTTAYDLLKIYKSLLGIPALRDCLKAANVKLPPTNKSDARTFWNNNSLISRFYSTKYFYDYAQGGKAASSSKGGYSLVSGAKKGDSSLIAIVLNSILDGSVNYSFVDATNLFNYGFDNFTLKTVIPQDAILHEVKVKNAKGTNRLLLSAHNPLKCFVLNDDTTESIISAKNVPSVIYAPVKKGDIIGTISYTYRDKFVGTVNLASQDELQISPVKYIISAIGWFFNLKPVKTFLAVLATLVIIYILVVIMIITKASKKNKKRRRRR